MRSIRKLALLGLAALMVCAAVAASASATTINAGGSAYSGAINGQNSGNAVLAGPFGSTITCTSSSIVGTTNSSGVGSVSSVAFSGCSNSSGSCTVTSNVGTTGPWAATAAFDSTHLNGRDGTMTITMGTSGTVTTTCGFITCNWAGSAGGTSHTVSGDLFNSDSSARFAAGLTSGCGTGTWTAKYIIRTGSTVGSGTLVTIAA